MFRNLKRLVVVVLLVCAVASAQKATPPTWQQLYAAGDWRAVAANQDSSADALFYKAMAFARLHEADAAMQALLEGQRRYRNDGRFSVELGGLYFQQKDYSAAIQQLQRAVQLAPTDEYANNLLGSLYSLTGNVEAAVKYWNRAGRPQIDGVEFVPEPRTDPVLLDRTLAVAPRTLLKLEDLRTTEARIEALGVFSVPQYALQAKADGQFDFVIRAGEKNGFGSTKLQAAVQLLRGLPYWTVYPEYYNAGGRGINITSLFRWDANKRRIGLNVAAPLRNHPSMRYRVFGDLRDENWVLSPDTSSAIGFHSRQYATGVAVEQVVNGTSSWGITASLVHNDAPGVASGDVFTVGNSLEARAWVQKQFLRVPEKRLSITARLSPTVGKNFGSSANVFGTLRASTELEWLPGKKAGDYEITAKISTAAATGTLPFSSLFMLGVERDNDLLLRGHPGTRDGKKGSAPLARDYLLGNFELTRRFFDNGLLDIGVGPFLDVARPWQTLQPGVGKWLIDPGVSIKLRVLGSATVTLSYGRNLQDGRNTFYASALR